MLRERSSVITLATRELNQPCTNKPASIPREELPQRRYGRHCSSPSFITMFADPVTAPLQDRQLSLLFPWPALAASDQPRVHRLIGLALGQPKRSVLIIELADATDLVPWHGCYLYHPCPCHRLESAHATVHADLHLHPEVSAGLRLSGSAVLAGATNIRLHSSVAPFLSFAAAFLDSSSFACSCVYRSSQVSSSTFCIQLAPVDPFDESLK